MNPVNSICARGVTIHLKMSANCSKHIHVRGLVQGVGFRPFIFRLATHLQVKGWVINGNDGVRIHAEGPEEFLDSFILRIREEAPPASSVREITVNDAEFIGLTDFSISKSLDSSGEITEISPDIAVCKDCLEDLEHQPHRINYPFINCTNCGPRFTIIRDLPYDREMTTMSAFEMCPVCQKEYTDIFDRRFHAQPVACNTCGPTYQLKAEGHIYNDFSQVLAISSRLFSEGRILAIKGLGGFHLACDALQETAVGELRRRKGREGKPFAVMFSSLESAREYLEINDAEAQELLSWHRPIVILNNRKDGKSLADSVSNGFGTTGAMLPYMPLHHMLLRQLDTPAIVLTSGNISDEPIVIDDTLAVESLSGIADAFISYNREIFNRTDDSVVMVADGHGRLIRRSRGYVPSPVTLDLSTEGIFAAGAELVNCFCVGRGNQAILSQHIGDLKNLETLDFYAESFQRFRQMFRISPTLVVTDLHPDYLSTRFAEEFAAAGELPVIRVQHHHAHIASCMAEHNLDEEVIGISMDGVGLGTDGNIWGFEVMKASLEGFERLAHLDYVPQPGGDLATGEPWRMAVSFIEKYAPGQCEYASLPFFQEAGEEKIDLVRRAMKLGINSPLTSSAGRLFDAVAALTGVCTKSSFHAEAPMRLENLVDTGHRDYYEINVGSLIHPGMMIHRILEDLSEKIPVPVISARFHRALVNAIVKSALFSRDHSGLTTVVLSGGVFQNRFLLTNALRELKNFGFRVYTQRLVPSNDGGLALGQLAVAAKYKSQ